MGANSRFTRAAADLQAMEASARPTEIAPGLWVDLAAEYRPIRVTTSWRNLDAALDAAQQWCAAPFARVGTWQPLETRFTARAGGTWFSVKVEA